MSIPSARSWPIAVALLIATISHAVGSTDAPAARRAYRPRILIIDLSASTPLDPAATWLGDAENIVARADGRVALLDYLPGRRAHRYLRERYRDRGIHILKMVRLEDFPRLAPRYFPTIDARQFEPPPPEEAETFGARAVAGYDGLFHSYEEVTAELAQLAADHPARARLSSLGQTAEGRELWALKISRDASVDDSSKPDVLFTGCHHAREWISVEPPMYFAHRLLEDDGVDDAVTALVDGAEIWIVPIVNPDGLAFSQLSPNTSTDSVRSWRKNRRPIPRGECGAASGVKGVDLNRNYASQWRLAGDAPCPDTSDDNGASDAPADFQVYRGPAPLSEAETRALSTLTSDPVHQFAARIDFHNYSQLVLYPWSALYAASPDATTQAALATLLAQRIKAVNGISYKPEPGVGLYVATGTSADHAYEIDHTIAPFIVELRPSSCCFYVPESLIGPINREAWAAASALIDWTLGPPVLLAVEATQDDGSGSQVVYRADWHGAGSDRALEVSTLAAEISAAPLRLTLVFSKPMAPATPVVFLGRGTPFTKFAVTASGADEGWRRTRYDGDTWVGHVDVPALGDAEASWTLSVAADDDVALRLDAAPSTRAQYAFGTDGWDGYESGPDQQHLLPPSESLAPFPSQTPTPTRYLSPTRTLTPSRTASRTRTPTASRTATRTRTSTRSATVTRSRTPTRTATSSPARAASRTPTVTRTPTASRTQTGTRTATRTRTPTRTRTSTRTRTPTRTRTATRTPASS